MKNFKHFKYIILGLCMFFISCEKAIDVGSPKTLVASETVFSSDISATAAVLGIYSNIAQIGTPLILDGGLNSFGGVASDELNFTGTTAFTIEIASNSISPSNAQILTFWNRAFVNIYQINTCIEGLSASTGVTTATKNQLLGECKFLRAINYHYLSNLFGDLPLITTTDYNVNAVKSRSSKVEVKKQILADLLDADQLLSANYPTAGKIRVNKWAVEAILARYYLFEQDWQNAEKYATNVINSNSYGLVSNLNNVFLSNSTEAIWQLMPEVAGYSSYSGGVFIPATSAGALPSYTIAPGLLNAFEPGDQRKTSWINNKIVSGTTYYYPYKYKLPFILGSTNTTEYEVVIRFAEQYLIRAEARAQIGTNLTGSQADINKVRNRAGLANTAAATQSAILSAIKQEMRIEFFAEHGHRWFDLIRWGDVNNILGTLKPAGWQSTDILWPIPQSDILLNPNMSQNQGY